MIRSKIEQILQGHSRFKLPTVPAESTELSSARAAGSYILWPMANTFEDIRKLLQALRYEIVPIIIPASMPRGKMNRIRKRFPCFGVLDKNHIQPPSIPCRVPQEIFLALLTSGSTGEPKIVATTEENLIAGITAIHQAQELNSVHSTGVTLPLAYSYSLVNQLFWAILYDRQLLLTGNTFSPHAMLDTLTRDRVEMVCLVAEQLRSLTSKNIPGQQQLRDVICVNFAGAPFPVSHFQILKTLFPNARIYNNYGCTEAMPRLTIQDVSNGINDSNAVGYPIDKVEIRIASDNECGPVEFRGPSTSIGYIDEQGQLVPHPSWIQSGDVGYIRDGKLYIEGRNDMIVTIGGERHSLMEIETAVMALPINHAMVWQIENGQDRGEIHLVLSGKKQISRSSLGNCFRDLLPRSLWPRQVFWSQHWPTSPNGKTDRTKLQQMARTGTLSRI